MNDPKYGVSFKFICGSPEDRHQRLLLELENKLYNDIIILDEPENMDKGKTYTYFKHVHEVYKADPFKFVMKADDDSWIHIPNLVERLLTYPTTGVYYGRSIGPMPDHNVTHRYMSGMGYGLSWDMVEYIALDEYASTHRNGPEGVVIFFYTDLNLGSWIQNKTVHFINEKDRFFQDPFIQELWAKEFNGEVYSHEFTDSAICIHFLKEVSHFQTVTLYFMMKVSPDRINPEMALSTCKTTWQDAYTRGYECNSNENCYIDMKGVIGLQGVCWGCSDKKFYCKKNLIQGTV